MSLLGSQVFANPTTPLWAAAGSGGGGSQVLSQTFTYTVPTSTDGGGPKATSAFLVRNLTGGIPALDGSGNSSVIPGLNLNLSNYTITAPAGTYVFNGYACETMISGQARLNFGGSNQIVGPTVGTDNRTYACPVQGSFVGPATFTLESYGEVSIGDARDWGTGNAISPSTFAALTLTKIA